VDTAPGFYPGIGSSILSRRSGFSLDSSPKVKNLSTNGRGVVPEARPRAISGHYGRLAQLGRALRLHRRGRRFDPFNVHCNKGDGTALGWSPDLHSGIQQGSNP
jgi:hypothetical protein